MLWIKYNANEYGSLEEEIAQVVECLPCMQEVLESISRFSIFFLLLHFTLNALINFLYFTAFLIAVVCIS